MGKEGRGSGLVRVVSIWDTLFTKAMYYYGLPKFKQGFNRRFIIARLARRSGPVGVLDERSGLNGFCWHGKAMYRISLYNYYQCHFIICNATEKRANLQFVAVKVIHLLDWLFDIGRVFHPVFHNKTVAEFYNYNDSFWIFISETPVFGLSDSCRKP